MVYLCQVCYIAIICYLILVVENRLGVAQSLGLLAAIWQPAFDSTVKERNLKHVPG
jgi:hypothetical protein